MDKKVKIFTDLYVWQEGHVLVLDIYTFTRKFPKEELFVLTTQLRRAAISITSNIAEGFSRNSQKEKIQFYSLALGSLTEVQNQLLVAKDIGYLSKEEFDTISSKSVIIHKMLNSLIKKIKSLLPTT